MKKVLVFMFLLLSVFSFSKSVVKTQSNNAAAAYKSLSVTRTVFKDASVQKFADDYAVFVQTFVSAMQTRDEASIEKLHVLSNNLVSQADVVDAKLSTDPEELQKFDKCIEEMIGIMESYNKE